MGVDRLEAARNTLLLAPRSLFFERVAHVCPLCAPFVLNRTCAGYAIVCPWCAQLMLRRTSAGYALPIVCTIYSTHLNSMLRLVLWAFARNSWLLGAGQHPSEIYVACCVVGNLATTRCGSNGRSQITGAHSSQSLKPRSHSPSQFLTKSLFALLQIALIRKHVPDPAPQFTTKSLLALYKITLCTFADRSDPQTRP